MVAIIENTKKYDMLMNKIINEDDKELVLGFLPLQNSADKNLIKIDTIVFIAAVGLESEIHLNNGNKFTFSENIKTISEKLPMEKFLVINNKYIVNIAFVNRYVQTDENCIVMHDGTKIPIPTKRNKRLDDILKMLYFF
jgi:DNA-binding LytR/AlgR family response regulator